LKHQVVAVFVDGRSLHPVMLLEFEDGQRFEIVVHPLTYSGETASQWTSRFRTALVDPLWIQPPLFA